MSDGNNIGTNYQGIDQSIYIGKDIGKFKTKEEALKTARDKNGSELVYQTQDNEWNVSEVHEKGFITDNMYDLSRTEKDMISIDKAATNRLGIKNVEISFVEDIDPEIQMALNRTQAGQMALVNDPSTPLKTLTTLAKVGNFDVREKLALSPVSRENAQINEILTRDPDPTIRSLMKKNPQELERYKRDVNNPLMALAKDPYMSVRKEVATRLDLPPTAFEQLARDPYMEVRKVLAKNPYLTPEAGRILASDPYMEVRKTLSYHPVAHLDPEIGKILTNDPYMEVRKTFAENPRFNLPHNYDHNHFINIGIRIDINHH